MISIFKQSRKPITTFCHFKKLIVSFSSLSTVEKSHFHDMLTGLALIKEHKTKIH